MRLLRFSCIFLFSSSSKVGLPPPWDSTSFRTLSLDPKSLHFKAYFSFRRFSISKAIIFSLFSISTNLMSMLSFLAYSNGFLVTGCLRVHHHMHVKHTLNSIDPTDGTKPWRRCFTWLCLLHSDHLCTLEIKKVSAAFLARGYLQCLN